MNPFVEVVSVHRVRQVLLAVALLGALVFVVSSRALRIAEAETIISELWALILVAAYSSLCASILLHLASWVPALRARPLLLAAVISVGVAPASLHQLLKLAYSVPVDLPNSVWLLANALFRILGTPGELLLLLFGEGSVYYHPHFTIDARIGNLLIFVPANLMGWCVVVGLPFACWHRIHPARGIPPKE